MNKIIWKLHNAAERLWLMASMSAQQAATLELEGKGLAVVAEETRIMAKSIQELVESALYKDEEIKHDHLRKVAFNLNILALNSAIESQRLGWRGKPAAVCADDIRNLACDVAMLFGKNIDSRQSGLIYPIPKKRMTSVDKCVEYIQINIAGIVIMEPLANIKEVCIGVENIEAHNTLRGIKTPLIDLFKKLGKSQEESVYVILNTPWAEQNKAYAVVADVSAIHRYHVGVPGTPPPDTPFIEFIREYWESENEIPFIFMDWSKIL